MILEGSGPWRYAIFLLVVLPFAHSYAAASAAAPDRVDLLRTCLLWPLIPCSVQVFGTFAYAMGGTSHHGAGDEGPYIAAMLGLSVVHALPTVRLAARSPNLLTDAHYLRVLRTIGIAAVCLLVAAALSRWLQYGMHERTTP